MAPIAPDSKRYTRQFFTKNFWDSVAVKVVATSISVKVWILIVCWVTSTTLLVKGFISGGEWTTINGSVTSVVAGMRELYKIANSKVIEDKGQD